MIALSLSIWQHLWGGFGPPPVAGFLQLVDGVSYVLQTDGVSKIQLAA